MGDRFGHQLVQHGFPCLARGQGERGEGARPQVQEGGQGVGGGGGLLQEPAPSTDALAAFLSLRPGTLTALTLPPGEAGESVLYQLVAEATAGGA
ncbi:MAG TPA: hypothetical protein VNZ52_13980, partial [Candidatus Thermoplasmatota archaeon]|nr:hypothetical protein [Candidatus Thermoplasmatota archaeon]